jgi:hypothetical protein
MPPGVIVLHRPRRWITAAWGTVLVGSAPFVVAHPDRDEPRWVLAAIVAGASLLAWRQFVSRVEVTADEVLVVNDFGRTRVPLADVADVVLEWHDVRLVLRDGKTVDVDALGLGPRDPRTARRWRRKEYERLVAAIDAARTGLV